MVNILINDKLSSELVTHLENLGANAELHHYEIAELEAKLLEIDVLVIRSKTKVRKELLSKIRNGKLKLIVRAGVGIDNIDVEFANSVGIEVKNTPTVSTIAVAELTFAHMLTVNRNLHLSNQTMRDGLWNKSAYTGTELYGKTLGLVGMGRIAREVAKRAEVFGMNIIYNDFLGKNINLPNYKFVSMDDLYKNADTISLHIPFIPSNPFIIGHAEFEKMKDTAILINCSRGQLIDGNALIKALDNGSIAGAGLDVFENEPDVDVRLQKHDKISLTPHLGASTAETQVRIIEDIVSIIKDKFM